MKLKRDDTVMVMAGRDKGKTGKITAVLPAKNQVIVENINVSKRHTKPSDKNPRGGILDLIKPIDISKLMVIDPESGLPARIGYVINDAGVKERVFKVGAQRLANKKAKPSAKKTTSADKSAVVDSKPESDETAPKKTPSKAKKSEGGDK
jgi:large subunit ribosomal protein L24